MSKPKLDILDFLRRELAFLERGGYGGTLPWKPVSIFLDSPSCPNRLDPDHSTPCQECWLYSFVPGRFHQELKPCHFIALNRDGESIDSMSRQYTAGEVEAAVRNWLLAEIHRLEQEQQGENRAVSGAN